MKTWLVLAGAYVAGALTITYVAQGGILYPREMTAHLIIVPIFQAGLLGAIAAAGASGGFGALWRGLRSHRALWLLVAFDAVLVTCVWVYEEWNWLEDTLPENFALFYLIPKLALVSLVLVRRGVDEERKVTRYLVAVLGFLLLAMGWNLAIGRIRPLSVTIGALLTTLMIVWVYYRWRDATRPAAGLLASSLILILPVDVMLVAAAIQPYDFSDLWLANIIFTLAAPALTLIWLAAALRGQKR